LVSKRHQSTKEQEFFNRLKRKFKKVELFPAGSSLKFCLIASGDCHIYPRFGDVGQWDIAAGHAILKASGGNILDLTMSTIKYNSDRNMKINGFYALSNQAFYSEIIQ
jgi:3'(2'), 5'-bisphosphate nucleotidase